MDGGTIRKASFFFYMIYLMGWGAEIPQKMDFNRYGGGRKNFDSENETERFVVVPGKLLFKIFLSIDDMTDGEALYQKKFIGLDRVEARKVSF